MTRPTLDGPETILLWLRLLRASREIEAHLGAKIEEQFQTTLARFDVMAALHEAEARTQAGLTMTGLSRNLKVTNGNITGLVDRLEKDGLVERQPVPGDRRQTSVVLTEAGRKLFDAMRVRHEAWLVEYVTTHGFDTASVMRLRETLEQLTRPKSTKGASP